MGYENVEKQVERERRDTRMGGDEKGKPVSIYRERECIFLYDSQRIIESTCGFFGTRI